MSGKNRYSQSVGHFPITNATMYGHITWFKIKYKQNVEFIEKLVDNIPLFGMIGVSKQMPDDYTLLKIKDYSIPLTPKQLDVELPRLQASYTNEVFGSKLKSLYEKYLYDANVHYIDIIEIPTIKYPDGTEFKKRFIERQ